MTRGTKHGRVQLATAAARQLTLAAPAGVALAQEAEAEVKCYGVNKCKGAGTCGGKGHSCAGENSCKGQGYLNIDKETCLKIEGGRLTLEKK